MGYNGRITQQNNGAYIYISNNPSHLIKHIPKVLDSKLNQPLKKLGLEVCTFNKPKKLRNIGSSLQLCTCSEHKDAINDRVEDRIYLKKNGRPHAVVTIYLEEKMINISGIMNTTVEENDIIKKWASNYWDISNGQTLNFASHYLNIIFPRLSYHKRYGQKPLALRAHRGTYYSFLRNIKCIKNKNYFSLNNL